MGSGEIHDEKGFFGLEEKQIVNPRDEQRRVG